jgi:hypothetical protein
MPSWFFGAPRNSAEVGHKRPSGALPHMLDRV